MSFRPFDANRDRKAVHRIWLETGFGLGYRDNLGKLTHFVWGENKEESGPYKISYLAYQDREQFLELLALLKTLSDQILCVQMIEPGHVQMQDMIKQPFRHQNTSKGNKFQEFNEAEAYWQLRINDLPSCLAMTRLPARPGLSFNLCLADPISEYLADDQAWQGIGGDYTIHFGEQSEAMPGHKKTCLCCMLRWEGSAVYGWDRYERMH